MLCTLTDRTHRDYVRKYGWLVNRSGKADAFTAVDQAQEQNIRDIKVTVKSGSTPVGGPVKSGRKQTKDKGRGLDKELVRPELVTAWIQTTKDNEC